TPSRFFGNPPRLQTPPSPRAVHAPAPACKPSAPRLRLTSRSYRNRIGGAGVMTDTTDVWRGTLALMILKTLETMGPLHGYGVARRIEQTSGGRLVVHYGTLYPALLKLEQEGYVASSWGVSENNRKARFYRLTAAGRRHLARESREWALTTDILASFFGRAQSRAARSGGSP